MYKNSATNLAKLTKGEFRNWLNSFDTILSDCDGVLWYYVSPVTGSPEAMNKFKSLGKKTFLITNNSTKTREGVLEKAKLMNYDVQRENILSASFLTAQYLQRKSFNRKVFIIGSEAIAKELEVVGIEHCGVGADPLTSSVPVMISEKFDRDSEVGCVVVGFDEHFSFPKMFKATSYLNDPNVLFLATDVDARVSVPGYIIPGTGGLVRCIETSSQRKAKLMGKPNPFIGEFLVEKFGVVPERALMIGDDCKADILFGNMCGFQTLLVETGIDKYENVLRFQNDCDPESSKLIPDFYTASLSDLLPLLNDV